ncbi:MAG: hypothetical protein ACYC0P_10415 [Thiobacillus sp.]
MTHAEADRGRAPPEAAKTPRSVRESGVALMVWLLDIESPVSNVAPERLTCPAIG